MVDAWRGHGSPGMVGTDLQNSPNIGGGSTGAQSQAQSYVLGMPGGRIPQRPWLAAMPGVGQGVPGTPAENQYGNPSVQTWDVRQRAKNGPGTWPQSGQAGWVNTGNAQLPGDPYGGDPIGKPDVRLPFQEDDKLGGWSMANDKLVTHDRHVFWKVGYENSGRGSGQTDPPMDGPPRPILATVNRTINWQQGTVYADPNGMPINAVNGNADDITRDYQKVSTGQYLGEQGTGWAPVYGGVPSLYQPYGSYAGYTAGPVKGIQSDVPEGAPGDGPRKVFSGPPHGLHSPTLPDYSLTYGYYQALPLPRAPRQDRPDNSSAAGQSYSQTVVPQGQTGTVMANLAGGKPTQNVWNKYRFSSQSGWRGMTGFGQ